MKGWLEMFVLSSVRFRSVTAVLLSLCTGLGAVSLRAQVTTGRITGVAHDESGAALSSVQVTLTSDALPGGPATTVTDSRGEYRFTGLQPGTYSLRMEVSGFATYLETDLRVVAASTTERNVTFKIASVAEIVTVSGEAPVVDVTRVGVQNSIPLEQLQVTATERYGVQAYLTLMPGVTTNAYNRAWQVTVMGSASNETQILTDGVSINNPASGGSFTLGDFDAAQEVNATTLGASAEYQAAGGGVLQLISKSGTNQFHGDASGYWSPDRFTSQPTKLPCADAQVRLGRCAANELVGFHWHKYRDMSGHIGGPIVRDKAWFYGGIIFRSRYGTAPSIPLPPENEQFLDTIADMNWKFTWDITDKLQFQQSWYTEMFHTVNPGLTSVTRPLETMQHSRGGLKLDGNYGSQITWTMSPSTIMTARYNITQAGANRIGFFEDLVTPAHIDQNTGIRTGNFTATRFRPRRDEASAKFNTYLPLGSSNSNISYGVQISRNKDMRIDIQPGGVVYQDLSGQPDQAQFTGPDVRGAISRAQGFWGENEMTLGRFTLKFGGRFDRMMGISQDVPQFDTEFNEIGTVKGLGKVITWKTFSPRGGISYRLTKDGKTTLRATAGRYYLPLFVNEFEVLHPARAVTRTLRYDPATRDYTTLVSITDPRSQIRFDPETKPPYTDQFAIGADREIARNFAVGVNVIYKRGGNLLGWRDTTGIYDAQQVTLPDGSSATVFNLQPQILPATRIFLRTNGPGNATVYRALILTATKRLSQRWQMTAGYTRQRAKGQDLGSTGNAGQDPNDYINAYGGLGSRDRPNMFSLMGSYEVPKIGVQVSGNMTAVSGTAIASVAQVRLRQGTRAINLEPAGSKYRTESEQYAHLRISKFLLREGSRKLEVAVEFKNLLNEQGAPDIITNVLYDTAGRRQTTFNQTSLYPEPRQMRLFARFMF